MSFDTEGVLSLDANDYIAEAEAAADASEEFADSAENTQDTLFEFDAAGAAASGGIAAAGGAMQGALDGSKDWRESLGRTSTTMGITSDEASDLAKSISDATFPMDDAVATMDSLAQQGVDTTEEMERLAVASDDIADATGTSAESVADNLAPAIRSLDGDLEGLEDNADAFTLAVRDSNLETEDLAMAIERSSEELQEMGVSSDEAAGLIAEYADETGKSGSRAARDFGSALNEADGDLDALIENTELSEDVLEDWSDELEANAGITEEHADAANESTTTMDDLRASFDDVLLSAGNLLGPIDALAPALMGLGGAGMFLSTVNLSSVVPSLGAVYASLTPLLPVLLPLIAAVGALYVAWDENFLGIRDIASDFYEWFREATSEFVGWFEEVWEAHGERLRELFVETWQPIREFLAETLEWLREELFEPFVAWIDELFGEHHERLSESFSETWGSISEYLETTFEYLGEAAEVFVEFLDDLFGWFFDLALDGWDVFGDDLTAVVDLHLKVIREIFETALDFIVTTVEAALAIINGDFDEAGEIWRDFFGRTWGRIEEIVDDATDAVVGIVDTAVDLIHDAFKRLYNWLVGNSVVPDMMDSITDVFDIGLDDVVGFVDSGVDTVRDTLGGLADWVSGPWDIDGAFDGAMSAAEEVVSSAADRIVSTAESALATAENALDTASDAASSASSAAGSAASSAGSAVSSGASKAASSVPSLDTGGVVQQDGLAMIHEGEHIYNPAKARKGNPEPPAASAANGSVSDEVEDALESTDRTDEILDRLDRIARLLEALDAGDVRAKDVLKALDVAQDRRSGRNPLGGA